VGSAHVGLHPIIWFVNTLAREYFAISGTIYLVGRIQQEPFTCDILAQKQRKYLEFLEQLFGKHAHCG